MYPDDDDVVARQDASGTPAAPMDVQPPVGSQDNPMEVTAPNTVVPSPSQPGFVRVTKADGSFVEMPEIVARGAGLIKPVVEMTKPIFDFYANGPGAAPANASMRQSPGGGGPGGGGAAQRQPNGWDQMRSASANETDALARQADVKQSGEAEAAAQNARMLAQRDRLIAVHKLAGDEAMAKLSQDVEAQAQQKVDPNRFWANASTGQKIAAAIGIALGGLAQTSPRGPHTNPALDIINTAIERDIQAQRENIANGRMSLEARRGLLAMNLQRWGNEENALDATRVAYLEQAKMQIQSEMDKFSNPIFRAKGQKDIADITLRQQQYADTISYRNAELAARNAHLNMLRQEQMGKRAVYGPDGRVLGFAGSDAAAKEFNQRAAAYNFIKGQLQEMIGIQEQVGPQIDLPGVRGELIQALQTKRSMIMEAVRQYEHDGTFKSGEYGFWDNNIPTPETLTSRPPLPKWREFDRTMDAQINAQLAATGVGARYSLPSLEMGGGKTGGYTTPPARVYNNAPDTSNPRDTDTDFNPQLQVGGGQL